MAPALLTKSTTVTQPALQGAGRLMRPSTCTARAPDSTLVCVCVYVCVCVCVWWRCVCVCGGGGGGGQVRQTLEVNGGSTTAVVGRMGRSANGARGLTRCPLQRCQSCWRDITPLPRTCRRRALPDAGHHSLRGSSGSAQLSVSQYPGGWHCTGINTPLHSPVSNLLHTTSRRASPGATPAGFMSSSVTDTSAAAAAAAEG
jgi:hypothetical protein